MSRAPLIPIALTTGPFNLEEARRHGLTKDHLLGASWSRLGGGFYALRAIAHDPNVVLAAAIRRQNRLVDAGYRLLRFTAADVLSAPDSVVALVRRALSAGTNQTERQTPARSSRGRGMSQVASPMTTGV